MHCYGQTQETKELRPIVALIENFCLHNEQKQCPPLYGGHSKRLFNVLVVVFVIQWMKLEFLTTKGYCFESSNANVIFFAHKFPPFKKEVELFQMHNMEDICGKDDGNDDHVNVNVMQQNVFIHVKSRFSKQL